MSPKPEAPRAMRIHQRFAERKVAEERAAVWRERGFATEVREVVYFEVWRAVEAA